jgi:putative cell wall-binding protein
MRPASKRAALAITAAAFLGLFGMFAASAYATPTKTSACTGCHSVGGGVTIAVTKTSATTANTTYSVKVAPAGTDGWAVFNGSTKVTYGTAATGSFTVANGATYTVYGVVNGGNSAKTTVSPTAPMMYRIPCTFTKGTDKYSTSIAVSKANFAAGVPAVVLATGEKYPDALCAAPLAKAYGGPILFVPVGSTMSAALSAEITRLQPANVFIVGDATSVSTGVENQVKALSWKPAVTRLGGIDRYATSALIADAVKAKVGTVTKIIVAKGIDYPDALAGSPLGAAKGWPILLAKPSLVPTATRDEVAKLAPTSCVILGSATSISDPDMNTFPAPSRLGGVDSWETCAKIADYAKTNGLTYGTLYIATGRDYADALVGGPVAGAKSNIMMLIPPTGAIPTTVSSRITANKTACTKLVSIGTGLSSTQANAVSLLLN